MGKRLPGQQRAVQRGLAFHDLAVDRHCIPGANFHEITELNGFPRTRGNLLSLGLTYDEGRALRWQADVYADVTQACLSVPACQGVTLWTFTDRYLTTIERLTRVRDIPLIIDRDYQPKPAAFALRAVLSGAQPREPGGVAVAPEF